MPATAKEIKVLIVEDNADSAESLAMVLRTMGCEPVIEHSRDAAVQILPGLCPQVVFMDYIMSGMSATVFIKHCRNNCPETKIVMVSAIHNGASLAKSLGVDAFFPKPMHLERVGDYLSKLISD